MEKLNTGDKLLDKRVNREQAIKMKKQAKFDAIKKENTKLLYEVRDLKKEIKKLENVLYSFGIKVKS